MVVTMKVYFRFPYGNPIFNLELPAPAFGNGQVLNTQVVLNRSRGGRLWTYSRPNKFETLRLQFEDLSFCDNYAKKNEIIEFFKQCAGNLFLYADHEGNYGKLI